MEEMSIDEEIINNVNKVEMKLSNAKKDTAILKVIKSYKDPYGVYNSTNYIGDHPIDRGIFGLGVTNELGAVSSQFSMAKELNKRESEVYARHYMIGISSCDWISDNNIRAISYYMALFFWNRGYQTFYGIHKKEDRYHIHIIVNAYSITGNYKLPINKSLKIDYLHYLRSLNFEGKSLKIYEANGYY